MNVRPYSAAEEIANAISHGLGIAAAVVGLTLLLVKGAGGLGGIGIASVSVYGGTLIFMFLCSTLYHAIDHLPSKAVLQRLDHCAIFLLIAGTYTPIMLIGLGTSEASALLGVIWTMALAGVLLKAIWGDRFKLLSLTAFLVMGWAAVFVFYQLWMVLPRPGFHLLWVGGLSYSVGVVFYVWRRVPFNHAIWHLFVLGGATCHCISIATIVGT